MPHFLLSERITLNPDQDIEEVKKYLESALAQVLDVTEVSPGQEHFHVCGTTGGLFDFVRSARVFAEFDIMLESTKTEKEMRIIVKGNTSTCLSSILMYLILFCLILLAGLLPGSIETGSEGSTALDALIFLLIGYYIKTEIDHSLKDAKEHVEKTLKTLHTRFSI